MLDMHPVILGARARRGLIAATTFALLAAGAAAAATRSPPPPPVDGAGLPPACPPAGAVIVERFLPADCMGCWTGEVAPATAPPDAAASSPASAAAAVSVPVPAPATPRARRATVAAPAPAVEWPLDWIWPTENDNAPLSPAALPEAAERLARLGETLGPSPEGDVRRTGAPPPHRPQPLRVRASLPYNGYFGVQMKAGGTWPAGSTAWIALVERIPAGTDATGPARQLLRSLVGPLALPQARRGGKAPPPVAPLFALRWPEAAQPARIVALAWAEAGDGRILQITSDRCR